MEKILLALAEMKMKMESYFSAKPPAAATDDPAIKSLETQLAMSASLLAVATTDLAARDTTISQLTTDLAAANKLLAAEITTNATLSVKLAAEAKRTDETLAALGVDPKTIPAAPAPGAPAAKATWTEKCRAAKAGPARTQV